MKQQNEHEQLMDEFTDAVMAIKNAIEILDEDPAKGLAYLTWYGLRMAEHAQTRTEGVVIVSDEASDRYISMGGMLCGPRGQLIGIEWDVLGPRLEAFFNDEATS